MKNGKIMAIAAALMMMAVCITVVDATDDADATSVGTVKVYYYNSNNQQWDSSTQTKYNLYEAIYGARTTLGYTLTTTGANTQWYSGYNPNMNYGLINEINNSTDFQIFGYNNTDGAWNNLTNYALGWFKPYADYVAVNVDGHYAAYANVAVVTQDNQGNFYDYTTITDMIPLTPVQNVSACLYSFQLFDTTGTITLTQGTMAKVLNGSTYEYQDISNLDLTTGITVYGYGSDAYLALLDAVGSNLSGQMTAYIAHTGYYTYYSWMDTLFGVGTVPDIQNNVIVGYSYWMSMDSQSNYLNWTLGYYSPEHPDSSQQENAFVLMYFYS